MHRFLMNPPKGMVVDHINGNGLDNRRCNLRICTQLQNSQNSRRRRPGKSRFRGVHPRGDKLQAAIQHNGEQMYLGLFDTQVEAARAFQPALNGNLPARPKAGPSTRCATRMKVTPVRLWTGVFLKPIPMPSLKA